MSFSLLFRAPHGMIQEVEVEPATTIAEVQEKICDCNRLLPRGRIGLYHRATKMQPNNSVREYNLNPAAIPKDQPPPVITVVILQGDPHLQNREDCTYESFIDLCFPANGDKDLPLNIQPLIKFKPSESGHMVYLPSLADINSLPSTGDGDMREYLGEEVSASLGFIKWTETSYNFRCFLLEINDESIIPDLKTRKYSSFVSNIGYTNGDKHSWQRYTRVSPIDAYVHINEADNSVRLLPTEALKPSTVYAIVLLNGVPVVPADFKSMSKPLFSYWRPGICEDMLIIFRTKKPRVFKAPVVGGDSEDTAVEGGVPVRGEEENSAGGENGHGTS